MQFKLPFSKKSVRFSELLPNWKFGTPATWRDWSTENAIANGYKTNGYVYSCINLLSKSAASIPWIVYKKTAKKEWQIVEDHPLAALLEKPNPFMSRKDLIEVMTMHLYLGGNTILTKVRAGKQVTELWALQPDAIKIIPDKKNFIGGYVYEKDGVKLRFDTADIVHSKFNDPANPYWGLAPLQAGAKVVDCDTEAQEWNKISLENRAITDGIFTFDHPLTKSQWEEAREMVRDQHQGIQNARSPWVLGAGAKWQQMSLSPAEMDFIESRKLGREEICSLFGVPPVMVGIYENATLANIQTARRIFWQDTLIPYLEDLKNCFNLQLLPDFEDTTQYYVDFDVSGVEALQDNFADKINNAKSLWSMGVPFNLINNRLELGFDMIDSGDVGFLPSSVLPADMAINPPEPPAAPPPPPPAKDYTPSEFKALNLPSDEHKQFYVKAVEQRRASWDLNLTRKAAKLFELEGEAVIAKLQKNGIPTTQAQLEALVESAIDTKAWNSFLIASWGSIVEEFGNATYDSLTAKGFKPDETKGFNPFDRFIQSYIIRMAGEKVTAVSKFTKGVIGGLVLNILSKPEHGGMEEVAKAVKSTYTDFSRYRAYRIGRTEVAGASNYGSMAGAKASGLKMRKQWVSAKDDRVRDSHTESGGVDGEIVDMEAKFSNGLSYPAEYGAGKASETIQCRCVIAYVTE